MTLMIFMIVCSCHSGDSGIVFVGVLFQTKVLAQDAPRIRSAFRFEGAITLSGSRCLTRGPIDNWPLPTIAAV